MRHSLVFLVTAVTIVAATPLDTEIVRQKVFLNDENTRNSILEQLLLSLMEEVRTLMINGSDTIPVLDPLVIDSLHVDENTLNIIPGHVTAKNIVVNGISSFEINDLRVTMTSLLLQRYRIVLDGSIPVIDINVGNYDLDLTVFRGSLFGNGDAKLQIVQPRVNVNAFMGVRLLGGIFISLLDFNINVSLEAFEPQITGLFNDPVISDFVSVFLKNLVEELFIFFEDDINELLSSVILQYGNEILADLDLSAILGM